MATVTSTPSTVLSEQRVNEADVFAESSTQEYKLGTRYTPNDNSGQSYVYCKNGAVALAAGKLVNAPAQIANHEEHVGGAGTVGAINSYEITVGTTMTTALLANEYDEGFVCVNKVTGLGYFYRIKSHTNSVTPVLTLHDPIQVALDTTSEITLVHNPNRGVIVTDATTLGGAIIGIPRIAVTAAYYFWAQTRGPACGLVDTGETLVIGENVGFPATAGGVAGGIGVVAATDPTIGRVLSVNVAAEYAMIDLQIS